MRKIIVIFGGASVEHDVSIVTGLQAVHVLSEDMEVLPIYLGLDNRFYLTQKRKPTDFFDKDSVVKASIEVTFFDGTLYKVKKDKLVKFMDFDYVINCCHGGVGENGELMAYFQLNKVKCSSSSTLSSEICMNKFLTKVLMKAYNIPVVEGVLLREENLEEKLEEIQEKLSENLIVKPNSLGSSIGVIKTQKNNLREEVLKVLNLDKEVLVENCVEDMCELNCSAYKRGEEIILSQIERVGDKKTVLSFDDKYCSDTSKREIPANIPKSLQEEICFYTKKVYNLLDMSGVVRLDFMYNETAKKLYLNEINTIPGSLAYYLYQGKGITYSMLCEDIMQKNEEKKQTYFESQILFKTGLKIK